MADKIETLDHSLIQHGPTNQRIYLMKLSGRDLPDLLGKMDRLAERKGYTKIFAKVPLQVKSLFRERDYVQEAAVPNFYHGRIDGVFLSKYLSPKRKQDPRRERVETILQTAREAAEQTDSEPPPRAFTVRPAEAADCEEMAALYREVFESYPFPIFNPHYLEDTMGSHVKYFCALDGDRMVAAGSCEMDRSAENVEMTDFATLPDYRKQGLAQQLLETMEAHMRQRGMKTFYTIARALSPGMNITFAKSRYTYGGTLIQNTHICGRLESMNVWYKHAG